MKQAPPIDNTLPDNSKYLIIPNSTMYDEEKELWKTDLGTNTKERALLYTVWGATKAESLEAAKELSMILGIRHRWKEFWTDAAAAVKK